ncbi:MAG: hypothetical protein H6888_03975 [Nitratireductor sp.]|nr:hypothetical protein [Nitratireductor sp.]
MRILILALSLAIASPALAEMIPYNPRISMKVGQTVVLKGIRSACDGNRAPNFHALSSRFPRIVLGKFKDGGTGTMESRNCGKEVPARKILFTATKKGHAKFNLYQDEFDISIR